MPYALADTIRRCALHENAMEARKVVEHTRAFSSSVRTFQGLRTTPLIAGAAVGVFIISAVPTFSHVGAAHAAVQPSAPAAQPAKPEPSVSKEQFIRYVRTVTASETRTSAPPGLES